MPDAFDRPVVEVHVRHIEVARPRDAALISLHREPVVLRCDEHSAASHLFYRVIATAMAVRKLDCRASEREAEQLMPEANSKYRSAAHRQLAYFVGRIVDCIRITRTVR